MIMQKKTGFAAAGLAAAAAAIPLLLRRRAVTRAARWTAADIPDQDGKIALVTGANTGIGFETARLLAQNGAHVVLACRSQERGDDAIARIRAGQPRGDVDLLVLDLGSLASVRDFAPAFRARYERLDILINNAGVMMPPRSTTADGWELQWGVNVLGHFALTGLLLPLLTETPRSRVVTVSSLAARRADIDFDNLRSEKDYQANRDYGQSKLGDLLFAFELQRRLAAVDIPTLSLAAHPGVTPTDLQRHGGAVQDFFVRRINHPPEHGALPSLFAATAPVVDAGGYYGPDGFYEIRGFPAPAIVPERARDLDLAARFWTHAESATDVHYMLDRPAAGSATA